jgi:hypothetical protein
MTEMDLWDAIVVVSGLALSISGMLVFIYALLSLLVYGIDLIAALLLLAGTIVTLIGVFFIGCAAMGVHTAKRYLMEAGND